MNEARHKIVLVGYGHAGRIHKRAYDKLEDICAVAAVVEPDVQKYSEIRESLPQAGIYRGLGQALVELGNDAIIDFCVPAKINLKLVETALGFGITRFLIEKPLGWDVVSSERLVTKLDHCEVVYLDTYAASKGLQQLLTKIQEQGSTPKRVDVIFHKNRVPDSLSGRGFVHGAFPNAWMIEGPHMLSISKLISGEIEEVSSAGTFDMEMGDDLSLPAHGGGHASLEHHGGSQTHLDLNMCSDRNERRIEVRLSNGVHLTVNLPPSKATEQYSVLEIQYPGGATDNFRFEDRPMENCVCNAIRFLGGEEIAVSRLSDGLAVCSLVEKITKRKQFWQSVPRQWQHFGPPLRPSPEDIRIMEEQVARWSHEFGKEGYTVLLCGVTPEIAGMNWPASIRLWAIEKSRAMIEEVWPAKNVSNQLVLEADWTQLPFLPDSFDIVIGDGCLSSLAYPQRQSDYLSLLKGVLKHNGLLIMRFFVQKDVPERPEDVFEDLARGNIGNFHVFKWRLTMSLQPSASEGVRVDDVWRAWTLAGVSTDFPRQAVDTIDTYKDSDHILTFTTMDEIRRVHAPLFREKACIVPGYELGERCPIMVFAPG